jgi:hypothetical protein
MEGKFHDHQKLLWDGKGVAARGPVGWEAEDKSISLHVAILQNGVTASGWTGNDVPHGANEFLVAAGVEGKGTLKEGPATATGWAFIHGNGIEMYEWTVPVELVAEGESSAGGSSARSSARSAAGLPEQLKEEAAGKK